MLLEAGVQGKAHKRVAAVQFSIHSIKHCHKQYAQIKLQLCSCAI